MASLPADYRCVLMYICFLRNQGKTVGTIRCRLSAVADKHKLLNLSNPIAAFAVSRLLNSYKKLDTPLIRKPIGADLLKRIMQCYGYSYTDVLFKALFTLMYSASLRIGEVALSGVADHVILKENCSLRKDGSLKLHLKSFKHSVQPVVLVLKRLPEQGLCPVSNLLDYLKVRPCGAHNALFLLRDGKLLTRQLVANELSRVMNAIGLVSAHYNTHSLRIGRATDMFTAGASDERIRLIGRWNSDAWRSYIKPGYLYV